MSDLVGHHKLAFVLKLPREWLLREAEAGRIPCLKVEKQYLFSLEAVRKALADLAAKERLKLEELSNA